MTLDELKHLMEEWEKPTEAEAAEMEAWKTAPHAPGEVYAPEYYARLWEEQPRLYLHELPPELIPCTRGLDDVQAWKRFLLEMLPMGTIDLEQPEELEAKIKRAISLVRYEVNYGKGYDEATKENIVGFELNIRGTDALEAWQKAGGRVAPLDYAPARRRKITSDVKKLVASVAVTTHVMPTSKLAIMTPDILRTSGGVELDVSKGRKGKALVRVLMTYEGGDIAISSRKPITAYDISVNDTVASLWEYGSDDHVFTPAMLCRAMTGQNAQDPSQQQIEEAIESLERQAAVRVTVDCTEQLKAHGITEVNGYQVRGGKIRTNLLMVEAIEIDTTGGRVMGYHMLKPPIRYEYSKLLKQVVSVPIELLDIRETTRKGNNHLCLEDKRVRNSRTRIAVKEYLLRRICVMKGKTKQSNRILLATIYKEVGLDTPTAKEQRAINEYVEKVLLYWQAKQFIKGYAIVKRGRKFEGVDIFYDSHPL